MAMACVNGVRECDGCMMCRREPFMAAGSGCAAGEAGHIPCPCCGSEDYEVRYRQGGDWIGCDKCITADWL